MAILKRKPKKGERVLYDEHECLVLDVKRNTVVLRNQYGFPEAVKFDKVKRLDDND